MLVRQCHGVGVACEDIERLGPNKTSQRMWQESEQGSTMLKVLAGAETFLP